MPVTLWTPSSALDTSDAFDAQDPSLDASEAAAQGALDAWLRVVIPWMTSVLWTPRTPWMPLQLWTPWTLWMPGGAWDAGDALDAQDGLYAQWCLGRQ